MPARFTSRAGPDCGADCGADCGPAPGQIHRSHPAPELGPDRGASVLPPVFLPAAGAASALTRGVLPLQGLTLLAVEDSRFACDALRLMCQRSGARLRRAETLLVARAHLMVYRPDVVIIDLGLPDGRGEGLIRELAAHQPRMTVILGTSGDPDGRASALAAGAEGFLEKPLHSLAGFQAAILRHLPDRAPGDTRVPDPDLVPDTLALHDDLARAADLLGAAPDPQQQRYLAGFVSGLARSAQDAALEQAADAATGPQGLARLSRLLKSSLDQYAPVRIAPQR